MVGLDLRWVEETAFPGAKPLVLSLTRPAIGLAISRLPRQDLMLCTGFQYWGNNNICCSTPTVAGQTDVPSEQDWSQIPVPVPNSDWEMMWPNTVEQVVSR